MHRRPRSSRSPLFGATRGLIAVAVACCLAFLGAYVSGVLALTPEQLGGFAVVSTCVFAGLAVAYELQT